MIHHGGVNYKNSQDVRRGDLIFLTYQGRLHDLATVTVTDRSGDDVVIRYKVKIGGVVHYADSAYLKVDQKVPVRLALDPSTVHRHEGKYRMVNPLTGMSDVMPDALANDIPKDDANAQA